MGDQSYRPKLFHQVQRFKISSVLSGFIFTSLFHPNLQSFCYFRSFSKTLQNHLCLLSAYRRSSNDQMYQQASSLSMNVWIFSLLSERECLFIFHHLYNNVFECDCFEYHIPFDAWFMSLGKAYCALFCQSSFCQNIVFIDLTALYIIVVLL